MIPRHSPRTSLAQARLLQSYNDIDIFVEDVATQNLYVRLLGRILGRRRTLTSVVALDGRKNVLDRCAADQLSRNRPRLYLIDGDLDLLNGVPKRRLKYLHRLSAYCSENLVATEHAALQVAQEGRTDATYATLKTLLGIDQILARAEQALLPLFVLYAVVQRLGLGIPTVAYSVHQLLEAPGDPASLSPAKIRARMREVLVQLYRQVDRPRYLAAKRAVRKQVERTRIPSLHLISGKTYTLPLVQLQLHRLASVQCTKSSLAVRLATHCELDVDPSLKRAVKMAARSR